MEGGLGLIRLAGGRVGLPPESALAVRLGLD